MGLSIHYTGAFKKEASLSDMIEEVKDIAENYHWKYEVYESSFPDNTFGNTDYDDNIYGISFTPPDCETVTIAFLSNGKMSGPVQLMFFGKNSDSPEPDYLNKLFVKTQYAGQEVHKLIIHLFKHLSIKYFHEFTLFDEGKYWETNDEKLLKEIFDQYTNLIEDFSLATEVIPINREESFDNYFERLINQIQERKRNKT